MNKLTQKSVLSALAAGLTIFACGLAQAAPVNCGDVLVSDTKLNANLDCSSEPPADGLVIGANGVTFDLNGYTVTGPGQQSGIYSGGFSDFTIKNGAITGFDYGLLFVESENVRIQHLTLANNNGDAMLIVDSSNVAIVDVQISVPDTGVSAIILIDVDDATLKSVTSDGGGYGVLSIGESRRTRNLMVQDSVFANIDHEGVGIRIINNTGVNVHRNTIIGNESAGGCYAGIDVVGEEPGTHMYFSHNVITGCGFGIFVPAGPPSTDIHIQKNHLYANEDGIFLVGVQNSRIIGNRAHLNHSVGIALVGGTVGNKILHNMTSGNGVWDIAHTPDSTPNDWHANTCGTSEGTDVDCR